MQGFEKCLKVNQDFIKEYTCQQNKAWIVVERALTIIEKNMHEYQPSKERKAHSG